jgi:hypothetical protein
LKQEIQAAVIEGAGYLTVFALPYLRRNRCAARLAKSKAFRWTRGSLASLSASLRTFGFLSKSVALWRSLPARLSSSDFSPFFFLNNGYPPFIPVAHRAGISHQ